MPVTSGDGAEKVRTQLSNVALAGSPRSGDGPGSPSSSGGAAAPPRGSGGSDAGGVPTPPVGRQRIVALAAEEGQAPELKSVPKSEATRAIIAAAIRDNPLFSGVGATALATIVDIMTPLSLDSGVDVITQGDDQATQFFVVEFGALEVWQYRPEWKGAKKVADYSSGNAFGELALLHAAPRAATVRTTAACKLWVAERAVVASVKRAAAQKEAEAKMKLLNSIPMLDVLTDNHKRNVAGALKAAEFAAGQALLRKGERAATLYIIREGTALVKGGGGGAGDGAAGRRGPGDLVGEAALLSGKGGEVAVEADVEAEGRVVAYAMGRADFEALLGGYEDVWRYHALRKVPVLSPLSDGQVWRLVRAMEAGAFKKGATVFSAGDAPDKFYIVRAGAFSCFLDDGTELVRVGRGQCFGELALLNNEGRACNVICIEEAQVLTLGKAAFAQLLGDLTTLRTVWLAEALRRVPLFGALDDAQRSALAGALTEVSVRKGEAVVRQGEEGSTFYVLESGEAAALKDGSTAPVKLYRPGDCFGELALLEAGGRRRATVVARSDATLLALSAPDFHRLLAPVLPLLREQAKKYGAARPSKLEVGLADLEPLAVLGAGGFGRVTLVRHGERFLALKQMAKAYIVEQRLVPHVHREKKAMMECDSPFLVNLLSTLKDAKSLYMLMEVVLGGELFAYMQARGRPLSESHARFYVASVVMALGYLHERSFVYRDLKPENLLIGVDGYVKMADFGFVKLVPPHSKTLTLCGTPEYMAPEVITGQGHWQAADWWSVGVLVYELVAGTPPFYCGDDRNAMYKRIVAGKYATPSHFSQELRDLVSRLLTVNPSFRLGSGPGGVGDVMTHPWFKGFDWVAFASKKLPAPYTPKVSHPGDARNFSAQVDERAAGGAYLKKPYTSVGNFKDF